MFKGRYGIHGGQYIPEILMDEIHKLEEAYEFYKNDKDFNDELLGKIENSQKESLEKENNVNHNGFKR